MSLKRSTNHLTDNVMVNGTAGTSSRAESPHVINTPLRSLQQCPGGSQQPVLGLQLWSRYRQVNGNIIEQPQLLLQ